MISSPAGDSFLTVMKVANCFPLIKSLNKLTRSFCLCVCVPSFLKFTVFTVCVVSCLLGVHALLAVSISLQVFMFAIFVAIFSTLLELLTNLHF